MKFVSIIKRYRVFILLLTVDILVTLYDHSAGSNALQLSLNNILYMLTILPPIFILLGLFDVWIDKQVMIRYLGKDSGWRGGVIAFLLGSAAAGPLYGAFPLAAVMIKKECKFTNVFIMLGAWSTTKIPLLMFEASALGLRFMLIRLGLDAIGIVIMAVLLDRRLNNADKAAINQNIKENF